MRMRGVLFGAAIGTALGITASRLGRWKRTWGVTPDEAAKSLPGDDIVADAIGSETRGITIEAPVEDVWPWLLQMGFGRGGWYSYDQLDQRGASATSIVPDWQTLAVGDVVPTHPGGGFEVAAIEPLRALVLRTDTALVTAQAEAAKANADALGPSTPGLAASGAILSSTPQQFSATWAFVLEPIGANRTRLIERFRIWYGAGAPGSRFAMPFIGFGVFVMMQKQMIGIRERAERLAGQRATPPALPPEAPGEMPSDGTPSDVTPEGLVGATS